MSSRTRTLFRLCANCVTVRVKVSRKRLSHLTNGMVAKFLKVLLHVIWKLYASYLTLLLLQYSRLIRNHFVFQRTPHNVHWHVVQGASDLVAQPERGWICTKKVNKKCRVTFSHETSSNKSMLIFQFHLMYLIFSFRGCQVIGSKGHANYRLWPPFKRSIDRSSYILYSVRKFGSFSRMLDKDLFKLLIIFNAVWIQMEILHELGFH